MQPRDCRPPAAEVASMVTVVEALELELGRLGEEASLSPEASSLFALARMLDEPDTADTARPSAAREMRETLGVLRARIEKRTATQDRLDELAGKRGTRRSTG